MKITLIIGPQASGKTTTAKGLTTTPGTVWANPLIFGMPFAFDDCTTQTKTVVFDGIAPRDLPHVQPLAESKRIKLNKGTSIFYISPSIVITCQCKRDQLPLWMLHNRNIELIDLSLVHN